MKLNGTFLFGLGLLGLLLMVSCQSGEETAVINTPATMPTSTAVPTATIEATPLPTATATQTPVVTLTPLPTFAPDELETAVTDLLANTMNCDVPCWWGAIPDVTTLDEIKHALAPYNFDIYEYYEDGQLIHFRLGIGYVEETNDFEEKIVYNFFDSILTGITAYTPSFSQLLVKYGQPDEIMLNTQVDPRQDYPWLWFTVVYLSEGVGFSYLIDGKYQNDMVVGCIGDKDTERSPDLRLEVPNSATSYKDFSPVFRDGRYIPLQEATGLTINDFMQPFRNPSQPQCFETPIELWE